MNTKHNSQKEMPEILMSSTMRRIEHVDRSLLSRQEQLDMDLFRFSYYTGGMSIRDMANLTADKIEGDLLLRSGRLSQGCESETERRSDGDYRTI